MLFRSRTAFASSLATVRSPAELHRRLRHNDFDPIDVVAGLRVNGGIQIQYTVDEFPKPNTSRSVVIPSEALRGPWFHEHDGGGLAVFEVEP